MARRQSWLDDGSWSVGCEYASSVVTVVARWPAISGGSMAIERCCAGCVGTLGIAVAARALGICGGLGGLNALIRSESVVIGC